MRWSYKTVHYDLKKEGLLGNSFLDESEIELSLNQYGKAGWELISLLETLDGLIAVFKQPLELDTRSFASPPEPAERVIRAMKGVEKKPKIFAAKIEERSDFEILSDGDENEDIAEAMLLDEFEVEEDKVEEDKVEEAVVKPSIPPLDIGMIRIE